MALSELTLEDSPFKARELVNELVFMSVQEPHVIGIYSIDGDYFYSVASLTC